MKISRLFFCGESYVLIGDNSFELIFGDGFLDVADG